MKLYCRDEITKLLSAVDLLQEAIAWIFANKNKDVIIPAYTHLQAAQVVLLAHYMPGLMSRCLSEIKPV